MPQISKVSKESREKIVEEVKDFARLFRESPERARTEVEEDLEKIELVHNNKYLALAVRTAADAAMDMVSGKLTHWMDLQLFLLKGQLLLLELLDLSFRKDRSQETRT